MHANQRMALMKFTSLANFALVGALACPLWADEPKKITYDDHIKPIFREHCLSCHNANDKKSGLALDTYQAVITGGSGGEVVAAGDLDSSRLYALTAHKEQPFMPPNQDMIPQPKVDLLKVWIEQGMPENSGSAIQKPKASSMALTVTQGRPEGAPPMPVSMLKQTPFSTQRAATTSALAASPWSPLVAVGGQMQVSLYHSETGQLLGILPFPEGEPQSITFSRDGKLVLVGGGKHSHSGYAVLYEIATGNRIARVGDELDVVLSADINDNNQLIALAGPQKMVRVYETLTGQLKYEQKKHTDWIYSVRFSPDGLLLATSDRSAGLVVWEADSGRLFLDLPGHKGEIRAVAWRPDSAALVSGSLDGTIKIWDMNEGKVLKSWDAHGGGVMAVSICNDGTMASAGRDNKVKIWDAGGNAAGEMPALVEAGHEVAITVDAKQVAAGDWAGNVRLWQRANPKDERSIPANPLPLETLLANAKSDLAKALEERTQNQSAYDGLLKKQSDLQAELQNLQKVLETSSSSLKNLTVQHNEIKPKLEGLQQQVSNKSGELSAVKAKLTSKRQILDRAIANKQKFDEEVLVHNKQRAAAGAETSQIDVKILEAEQQSAIQAVAIGVFNSEVTPLSTEVSQREKELVELQSKLAESTKQASEVALALEQNTKRKAEAEPAIATTQQSLKQATESVEPTKQKLDAVVMKIAQLEPLVTQLQLDLEAFQNRPAEINKRKLELDDTLAKTNSKVKEAESGLDQAKLNLEGISSEIAKLEQQLATLQKQLSEKSTLKETSSQDLRSKQESLDGLRSQVQQLESDSASALLQLQLFDEAYRKK